MLRAALSRLQDQKLLVQLLLSSLLFVPLIASGGHYDLLHGSIFESHVNSIEHTVVLVFSIASIYPLLIDVTLDLAAYSSTPFVYLRLVNIGSMAFCAGLALAVKGTPFIASVTITVFSWGYYIEFALLSIFFSHLLPDHFTSGRIATINAICFCWVAVFNLNCMSVFNSNFLFYSFYIAFSALVLVVGSISIEFAFVLRSSYLRTRQASLLQWMKGLESRQLCALSLLTSCSLTILVFLVVFIYFDPTFGYGPSISSPGLFTVELCRSFLGAVTYILPSRLFREELLAANRVLETKTEFVKYITHEIRTPAAILDVSVGLIRDELSKMDYNVDVARSNAEDLCTTSKQLLAFLDHLLLYEKLEKNSMTVTLQPLSPIQVFRAATDAYVDHIDILPPSIETLRTLTIDVDMMKLQLAFSIVLDALTADIAHPNGVIHAMFRTYIETAPMAPFSPFGHFRVAPEQGASYSIVLRDFRSGLVSYDVDQLLMDKVEFQRECPGRGGSSRMSLWIARKIILLNKGTISVTDGAGGLAIAVTFPATKIGEKSVVRDCGQNHADELDMLLNDQAGYVHLRSMGRRKSIHSGQSVHEGIELDGDADVRSLAIRRSSMQQVSSLKLTVLIVDDSAMVRKVMGQLLRSLGHEVVEAVDGLEAVEAVRAASTDHGKKFDLILMDNQM